MSVNTKARSKEIQAAAAALLKDKQVDVTNRVDIRRLAKELEALVNCHYDTAKNHIAKAVRRARGEIVKERNNWGGPRPNSGRPAKEESKDR